MMKKDIGIDRFGSDHIPFAIGQHWTKIAFDTVRIDDAQLGMCLFHDS